MRENEGEYPNHEFRDTWWNYEVRPKMKEGDINGELVCLRYRVQITSVFRSKCWNGYGRKEFLEKNLLFQMIVKPKVECYAFYICPFLAFGNLRACAPVCNWFDCGRVRARVREMGMVFVLKIGTFAGSETVCRGRRRIVSLKFHPSS